MNAARLEPTRVLDPARFPPRAVATYKRAAAEAAQLPRAELILDVPPTRSFASTARDRRPPPR